jgi:hypothetical protein
MRYGTRLCKNMIVLYLKLLVGCFAARRVGFVWTIKLCRFGNAYRRQLPAAIKLIYGNPVNRDRISKYEQYGSNFFHLTDIAKDLKILPHSGKNS